MSKKNGISKNISYLKKVHLKGYKSIYDVKIDLLPGLNFLIGPNGSGKSNFLEILKLGLSRENSKTPFFIKSELNIAQDTYEWFINVEGGKIKEQEVWNVITEKLVKNKKQIFGYKNESPTSISAFLFDKNTSKEVLNLRRNIFPKLLTFSLPKNVPSLDFPYSLHQGNTRDWYKFMQGISPEFSCINIIVRSFLSNLINSNSQTLKTKFIESTINEDFNFTPDNIVISSLRKFSPIQNIRINPNYNFSEIDSIVKFNNVFLEFLIKGNWLNWNQLSDGTKRLFYIFSEISIRKTGIFLIEEPELGIHPSQLHLLLNFLKEQSETKQIIITTHSPQVLNILEEDELDRIILTNYDYEKGTKLRKMTKKEIKKAQSYMEEEGLWLSDYWLHSDLEKI